jgi:putative CocE/NonD family hydrolase
MMMSIRVGFLSIAASVVGIALVAVALCGSTLAADKPVIMKPMHKVRVEQNVLIPMRDGKRLSANLVRPDAAGEFPVVLEYHPYRKDDISYGGHDAHHYLAERGFIGVRLDVRGTGGSEGVNTDEYMPIEQRDGYDAIEWLAKQPWSSGRVGMWGTSYGGFTSIQVAMQQPPSLKAIVPMYATDDRYTDDCHYTPGGNMRMYYDVGTYGGSMVAMNAMPPYPEFSGERWAELWKERLEKNEPYLLTWMKHQVDGPYWRAASLRPDYERIKCPVYLIGGWRDGYASAMLRMFFNLKVPKKLLMGPWVHQRPNSSVPGPRIDYLNEMARFFAHYLRDEDTGMMREPAITSYMQQYAKPDRTLDLTPGTWRHDASFPPRLEQALAFYLSEGGRLAERAGEKAKRAGDDAPNPKSKVVREFDEFEYLPTVGLQNMFWSAGGMSFYLADDQRADEAYSLVYTSPPFREEAHILGWPSVILHVSSTAKVATFVAKLSDVAPDGASALIVDGSLNATRRSRSDPTPMKPGEVYELEIPMNPTGWVIKPGHRLRLAISGADFPNLWPTPEKARHRVYHGGSFPSHIVLPVVRKSTIEGPTFLPAPQLPSFVKSSSKPPRQQVIRDHITGIATLEHETSGTIVLPDGRGTIEGHHRFRCSASSKDPAQASIVGIHTFVLKREDGTFEVTGESTIRATDTAFHIVINLTVTRNGKPFFSKQWTASEPRRML